jgi:hypothetical protein
MDETTDFPDRKLSKASIERSAKNVNKHVVSMFCDLQCRIRDHWSGVIKSPPVERYKRAQSEAKLFHVFRHFVNLIKIENSLHVSMTLKKTNSAQNKRECGGRLHIALIIACIVDIWKSFHFLNQQPVQTTELMLT